MNSFSILKQKLNLYALYLATLFICIIFFWVIGDIFKQGWNKISFSFLITPPELSGKMGGIGPVLLSTLMMLGATMFFCIPIGLGCALYLSDFSDPHSKFRNWIGKSLDAIASIPSIIFGLFGASFFCITLNLGFSILSGALTLTIMTLPLFIRSSEQAFLSIPTPTKQAATALGLGPITTTFKILIPQALPGLIAALILSIGRALSETAALIFTSSTANVHWPESFMDHGTTLSVYIYHLSMNVLGGEPTAYGSAFILLVLILCINTIASFLFQKTFKKNI